MDVMITLHGKKQYHVIRDCYGNWFTKLTSETRNEEIKEFSERVGKPFYREYEHKASIDWEWVKMDSGTAFEIETGYQKCLIAYTNLSR